MTAESLLKTLTLDQKLAQLSAHGINYKITTNGKFDPQKAAEVCPNGLFGVVLPTGIKPVEVGEWICDMLEFMRGYACELVGPEFRFGDIYDAYYAKKEGKKK